MDKDMLMVRSLVMVLFKREEINIATYEKVLKKINEEEKVSEKRKAI